MFNATDFISRFLSKLINLEGFWRGRDTVIQLTITPRLRWKFWVRGGAFCEAAFLVVFSVLHCIAERCFSMDGARRSIIVDPHFASRIEWIKIFVLSLCFFFGRGQSGLVPFYPLKFWWNCHCAILNVVQFYVFFWVFGLSMFRS